MTEPEPRFPIGDPRILKETETLLRTGCGYTHWWWPAPEKDQPCLCGQRKWKDA